MQLQIFSRFQRLFSFGAHPEDTYQQKLWEGLQIGLQEWRPWLFPKNTKRKIQSQRQDWDGTLNSLRKEDIPMLPQQFQLTKNGEQFFCAAVAWEMNSESLCLLLNRASLYLEKTNTGSWMAFFKGRPGNILSNLHNTCSCEWPNFLCAYGPNKIENTWSWFFFELVNRVRNVGNDLENILIDFKRAAINASHKQMPNVKVCVLSCSFFRQE